jgi:D-glycero-D-manno-heptose 1,7-bisphosphate phosphatase
VKIVFHDPSLGPGHERMKLGISGLELRGHQVMGLEAARAGVAHADLVIGGRPTATAWLGWHSGAHGMVLSLATGASPRWSFIDRWCWESLDAWGIAEAPAASRETPPTSGEAPDLAGLDPVRIVHWSAEPRPAAPDAAHPDTETLERLCERVVARRRGGAARPALFLDRDGTLVIERGYASGAAQMELLPGVPAALRHARAAGFALVVISNQSGVGRGLFSLAAVHDGMAGLRRLLRAHGVELDAIYFCPHRPEEGCSCRKPGPDLLRQAARDLNLSLPDSMMVGDRMLDVGAGQAAGARGILVRTGYGSAEESQLPLPGFPRPPDRICDDLADAVEELRERDD